MTRRKPRPSKSEATRIFRDSFNEGSVLYTRHIREQMLERGIDALDIEQVAGTGVVFHEPEPDIKTGQDKFTIECPLTGLKIVFVSLQSEEDEEIEFQIKWSIK